MNTADLVRRIARAKAMPKGPAQDPREKLWQIARAHACARLSDRTAMALLSWLFFKRGITDFVVLERITRKIAGAKNPYAYCNIGGRLLESVIAEYAGERQMAEHQRERQANLDFLGTTR